MTNSELLELCSELAHDRSIDQVKSLEREIGEIIETYKDQNAEVLTYTEEFQDVFNGWYDYFLGEVTKVVKCSEQYTKSDMEQSFIAGGKLSRNIENDSFYEFLEKLKK